MNEVSKKVVHLDFGQKTEEKHENPLESVTTAELLNEILRRESHEIVLRGKPVTSPPPEENKRAEQFQLAVELDREMERSVFYRVVIAIELIGLILILRTMAIHFI